MTTPPTACAQCTGIPTYRVTSENMPAAGDNFDQLVDHLPRLFTSPVWLDSTAAHRTGNTTVRHYPDGFNPEADGVVIAFAGTENGERIWFQNLPTAAVPT